MQLATKVDEIQMFRAQMRDIQNKNVQTVLDKDIQITRLQEQLKNVRETLKQALKELKHERAGELEYPRRSHSKSLSLLNSGRRMTEGFLSSYNFGVHPMASARPWRRVAWAGAGAGACTTPQSTDCRGERSWWTPTRSRTT